MLHSAVLCSLFVVCLLSLAIGALPLGRPRSGTD